MAENKKPEAGFPCCVYALEADQMFRNFHLQEIKDYGKETVLEDGTVLHANYPAGENVSGSRSLVRCRKCGALFLNRYDVEYDMYDGEYSTDDWYPVASEEEADLLNILLDGKNGNLIHPVRHPYRSGWHYRWAGEGEYTPHEPEELRKKIWEYYSHNTDSVLLEKLMRKAGKEHAAENTPMPEPEEPEEEEEGQYIYYANFENKMPVLIRLGSPEKLAADMYVYPGVWKDTPYLNDIRYGLGHFMDYDGITGESAMKIKAELDEFYQQRSKEETGRKDPPDAEDKEEILPVRFFHTDTVDEFRAAWPGAKVDALIFDRPENEDILEIQKMAATLNALLCMHADTFENVHMQIANDPDSEDVSWQRTEDGYALHLSAKSGKNWCQAAYQLGYLLMHCLIDYPGNGEEGISWAEELICEAAALELLDQLREFWEETPFGKEDPDYASCIAEYIHENLTDPGTSALLRCTGIDELKEINSRNLFDDRLDESHDLYHAMEPEDLALLAEVREYEADNLLLKTGTWRKEADWSEAVAYICRIQERIPGCGIPEEESGEDDPEEDDSGIIIDDWNDFDIIENMRYPNGRDDD